MVRSVRRAITAGRDGAHVTLRALRRLARTRRRPLLRDAAEHHGQTGSEGGVCGDGVGCWRPGRHVPAVGARQALAEYGALQDTRTGWPPARACTLRACLAPQFRRRSSANRGIRGGWCHARRRGCGGYGGAGRACGVGVAVRGGVCGVNGVCGGGLCWGG